MLGWERNDILPDGIFTKHYEPVEKVFHSNKPNADQRCYIRIEYGMADSKN